MYAQLKTKSITNVVGINLKREVHQRNKVLAAQFSGNELLIEGLPETDQEGNPIAWELKDQEGELILLYSMFYHLKEADTKVRKANLSHTMAISSEESPYLFYGVLQMHQINKDDQTKSIANVELEAYLNPINEEIEVGLLFKPFGERPHQDTKAVIDFSGIGEGQVAITAFVKDLVSKDSGNA